MFTKRTNGLLLAIGAVTVAGVAIPAHAVTDIDSIDLNTINVGNQVGGPETDNFQSVNAGTIGSLTNRVFSNDGVFTYTHEVTPNNINAVSEFNTGFSLQGFNGVAGYDFDQTLSAGGNGDDEDFSITFNDDNATQTLDFGTVLDDTAFFDDGETVTFFFQSDLPPGSSGDYNITNSEVGTAQSFLPVPTPTALSAAMLGLGGLALRRKRRKIEA